jgi:hypothetical protein
MLIASTKPVLKLANSFLVFDAGPAQVAQGGGEFMGDGEFLALPVEHRAGRGVDEGAPAVEFGKKPEE